MGFEKLTKEQYSALSAGDLLARQKELGDLVEKSDEVTDELAEEARMCGEEVTSRMEGIARQEKRDAAIGALQRGAGKTLETFAMRGGKRDAEGTIAKESPRSTMEYRSAFKAFVQGADPDMSVLQVMQRAGEAGTASNLGILLPETIVQEIMTDLDKQYGYLYSSVRKTNIQGGVKYPIGAFDATVKRISETTVSDRQNPGGVTGYIEFSYQIGEIRIARTLLQSVLSVPAFEQKFAEVVVKAYVRKMDQEIMTGDPDNMEMTGILTEANKGESGRIPTDNIIEFTEADMADWTSWQKNLFAKIPLAMRQETPEFVMTPATYEADIKTLKDKNDRPLYAETYNPVDGTETATFKARKVQFVENDLLADFDDAAAGDYFAMYWVPSKAYAVNTNMEFAVRDYFDEETNQYVKKALFINDGKPLDTKYLYLLKKKASA